MEHKLVMVINEMAEVLTISQLKRLQEVMLKHFVEKEADSQNVSNEEYLKKFLEAKRIEGCSDRTINYYSTTIDHMLKFVTEPIRRVTTEELRSYLVDYQKINNCSKVTVDNVRRNISSFFSWLEEEDYILKRPMLRIHKIKTTKIVKTTISDEGVELLRDICKQV